MIQLGDIATYEYGSKRKTSVVEKIDTDGHNTRIWGHWTNKDRLTYAFIDAIVHVRKPIPCPLCGQSFHVENDYLCTTCQSKNPA